MTVAVILPAVDQPEPILRQQVESVAFHFADRHIAGYYAEPAFVEGYAGKLAPLTVRPIADFEPRHTTDVVIFTQMPGVIYSPRLRKIGPQSIIWKCSWSGRMLDTASGGRSLRLKERLRFHKVPSPTNVFTRIGARTNQNIFFFPPGHLSYVLGMGPLDALGYRNESDYHSLIDRPASHKVIACFGGSATWSTHCLHTQMWPKVLERELNRHFSKRQPGLKFTVVNFGQLASVVLNEMFTFLLLCRSLKPDVVVAHDGYNDLINGQIGDPGLLHEIGLTYHNNLEIWAQLLHQARDVKRTQAPGPYRSINHVVPILRTYVERKRQFLDVVGASKGRFIWGLQPMHASKPGKHPLELHLQRATGRDYRDVDQRAGTLYELLLDRFEVPQGVPFVNLHDVFKRYGEEYFFMADRVHVMPSGDRVIGETYARNVIEMFGGKGDTL